MLALAAALLLIVPLGVFADPVSDTVSTGGSIIAHVDQVQLLQANVNITPIPTTLHKEEQLVEGHTVFVTLDAIGNATPVQGNFSLAGLVDCSYETGGNTSGYIVKLPTPFGTFGIPYPTSVGPVDAQCTFGDTVIITPSIYCQVQGDFSCTTTGPLPVLSADANLIPLTTPLGEQAYAREYTFQVPQGDGSYATYYAWEVPLMTPWHTASGGLQNMVMDFPSDKLAAMPDQDHYDALYSKYVPKSD